MLNCVDSEQRELYGAAKTIQKAYRTYRKREEDKEIYAASVIQNYYRRYKQVSDCGHLRHATTLIRTINYSCLYSSNSTRT